MTPAVPDGGSRIWELRAACREWDADLWFTRRTWPLAIAICALCPVLEPCRDAVLRRERGLPRCRRQGVVAGLTGPQRHAMEQAGHPPAAPPSPVLPAPAPRLAPTALPERASSRAREATRAVSGRRPSTAAGLSGTVSSQSDLPDPESVSSQSNPSESALSGSGLSESGLSESESGLSEPESSPSESGPSESGSFESSPSESGPSDRVPFGRVPFGRVPPLPGDNPADHAVPPGPVPLAPAEGIPPAAGRCATEASHSRSGEEPQPATRTPERGDAPARIRPAPCGTRAAYQRHLRRGEPVDAACRAANTHEAGRYRRTGSTRARPPRPPA
ncbi:MULTISPECIES: WhiB family transcriptional regulator [unclassified Streptomyces]|uniref:WhiB family transcriptional regulator n=1 Tax=unclassified Streptomyces TaxID=2593676 RepID=UPI000AF14493|nr:MULTISPECIES: WhiB family transcriptional regulator [unclassified Streptomyces]